jgi:hypothetical protein
MARYAVLNKAGNKVLNVVEAPADIANKEGWVAANPLVDAGDTYTNGVFARPTPNPVKAKREVKQTVRELLRRTDWTQVPDNLGAAKQNAWKTWRTSLRALMAQADVDPFTIVYPDPPGDLDEDGL